MQQQSSRINISNSQQIPSHNEQILVVPHTYLFQNSVWQGIKNNDIDTYIERIKHHGLYIARDHAETDPTYKQIIPYLVFTHNGRLFLMQRKSTASEQRLRNKLSLGIGGHVRQTDIEGGSLFDWARREFEEEVEYTGNISISTVGILNDDSNEVGKVHVGLVLMLHADSHQISIKSELKSGTLATIDECIAQKESMESWSQTVLEHIIQTGYTL